MNIFVFGSNLAGMHGAGSARAAFNEHGAEWGIGVGRRGNSYAIPTKDSQLQTLDLFEISCYVDDFLEHAREHKDDTFNIVAIGCGLAGFKPEEIAPMFDKAPDNCIMPPEFQPFLELKPCVMWRVKG